MAAISHLLLFDSGGIIIGIAAISFVSVMILLMWGWREFRRYLRAVKAIQRILQQPFREHSSTCSDVVLLPDSAPRNDDDSAVGYSETVRRKPAACAQHKYAAQARVEAVAQNETSITALAACGSSKASFSSACWAARPRTSRRITPAPFPPAPHASSRAP